MRKTAIIACQVALVCKLLYFDFMSFILNSNDAELLLAFEENPSLGALSVHLRRDQTVISKQLKRISETGDFLTKTSGRWKITQTGKNLNQATRDYFLAQANILKKEVLLTIGTTREFSVKVLSLYFNDLKRRLNVQHIRCLTFEDGIETAILNGQVDIAIECGRPHSPDIAFKECLSEPIVPVVSKAKFSEYKSVKSAKDLEDFPHVYCDRLSPEDIFKHKMIPKKISFKTNDVSTAINICLQGEGWALLPVYSIKEEIRKKQLRIINESLCNSAIKFGVWQYKSRPTLNTYFNELVQWMRENPDLLKLT